MDTPMNPVHLVRSCKAALDLAVLVTAFCLAFLIRFEGSLPQDMFELLLTSLPGVLTVKFLCLIAFGVRRLSWRYISLAEAKRLVTSLGFATTLLLIWRLVSGSTELGFLHSDHPLPLGILL